MYVFPANVVKCLSAGVCSVLFAYAVAFSSRPLDGSS